MGKPTGFLEFQRQLPEKEAADQRIQHYREFVNRFPDEVLNQQSARCMNCGVPFCHSGCPLGNIIPEFNDAVYRKQWKEAWEILSSTNNFPEFTGRICPAPCEAACVLGIHQPAVTIEEIEKHITEIAFEQQLVQPIKPVHRSGKKVAVIGSGPAGLAVAAQLNTAGHAVTVYERDDQPGGLLRYGIPDFKLEKQIVDRRIRLMEEEGITFKCKEYIGTTRPVADLLRENQAIVLACGSTQPRDLPIPGRNHSGVYFAMQFLKQQNKRNAGLAAVSANPSESNPLDHEVTAAGKHVIVIGGGDTGSDCVGTSIRQGAASVVQLELMPVPPTVRTASMPWPTYPMLLKTTSSHEEGCERIFSVLTKEFIADETGCLSGLKIVDVEWTYDANGRPVSFSEKSGTERVLSCQLALLAMGFVHPLKDALLNELVLELDERGNVRASDKSFQTSIPKVFVAGDMRRGQSLVVWAIREGRDCAARVDAFLNQHTFLEAADSNRLANWV